MADAQSVLHVRPEVVYQVSTAGIGVVQRPLSFGQRLANQGALRKTLVLIVLALIWEGYARWVGNELLFPTFSATVVAFWRSMINGELPAATWFSLNILFQGYAAGLLLAGLLTAFASATRIGADLLEVLTAMFNPLPSIALLPLAMIWFGLGTGESSSCSSTRCCGRWRSIHTPASAASARPGAWWDRTMVSAISAM